MPKPSDEDCALRKALAERRRKAEELIVFLKRLRPEIEHVPAALADWQRTLDAAEKFLSVTPDSEISMTRSSE